MELTPAYLRKLCREHKLYGLPSLNDKLYLHYKGLSKIQCLDEYTGLRALWLEGNGLGKIEGLDSLKELRTLFLHENALDTIEGLDQLENLDCINLSKNYIKKIENIENNQKLTNINLANNMLTDYDSVKALLDVPGLQTIDVQGNKINDVTVIELFSQFEDLRVLYLQGNPVVKNIPYYRKTIISKCKNLKYLDDRPVFEDERRRVNAWAQAFKTGGMEAANSAERNEIEDIRREKREADARNMAAFEEMMREGLEIKRQRELAASQNHDPNSNLLTEIVEGAKTDVNPFSGENIVYVPENSELREIREKRVQVLSNQENVNINHIMPPAPPSEGEGGEATMSKYACISVDATKPSVPPTEQISTTSWNKLQIESDDDEEGKDQSKEEQDAVRKNATDNTIENNVQNESGVSVSSMDLEGLD